MVDSLQLGGSGGDSPLPSFADNPREVVHVFLVFDDVLDDDSRLFCHYKDFVRLNYGFNFDDVKRSPYYKNLRAALASMWRKDVYVASAFIHDIYLQLGMDIIGLFKCFNSFKSGGVS